MNFKKNQIKIAQPAGYAHIHKQSKKPSVIYADFESTLKPINEGGEAIPGSYQKHEAYSVGYYLHCNYDASLSRYRCKTGANCVDWFIDEVYQTSHELEKEFYKYLSINMSKNEWKSFKNATVCYLCKEKFTKDNNKVRDHDHLSGKYRGAAHNSCNLKLRNSFRVPVFFHNLNYDVHFFIEKLCSKYEGRLTSIAKTLESFIALYKYFNNCKVSLIFLDSYKFLSTSLDYLVSILPDEKKIITRRFFDKPEEFELVNKKGFYPYEYMKNLEVYNECKLPEKKEFYSKLNDTNISDENYTHAQTVWNVFNCKTLSDYTKLYMKTDVLLLADCFKNFRETCFETYELDVANYLSLPSFSFDSMLKMTKVQIELLRCPEQVSLIRRGIRGGLSQVSYKYAKSNNIYLGEDYNPEKEESYILYLDFNNLYGSCMVSPLPVSDFQWVNEIEGGLMNVPAEGEIGYILDVDLEYPKEIHDMMQELPLCPEIATPPNSKYKKLMATLNDKKSYVIHYRALQQASKYGVKYKINKILKFKQSTFLKKFIDLNTELRKMSKNNFEKDFYKMINNSTFGKSLECVFNRMDVKLVSKWDGRFGVKSLLSNPLFHRIEIYSENFVAIQLRRTRVLLDKPMFLGMTILDVSKFHVFNFFYEFVKKVFGPNSILTYTDTDSLCLWIKNQNPYDIIREYVDEHFDTADYPEDNIFNIPRRNNKVLLKLKDEFSSQLVHEFVGLRSKMYGIKLHNSEKELKKAKGIKKNIIKKNMTFKDYRDCILSKKNTMIRQNLIQSKRHETFTVEQRKKALDYFDDKRYQIPGTFASLPHGHYKIKEIEDGKETMLQ